MIEEPAASNGWHAQIVGKLPCATCFGIEGCVIKESDVCLNEKCHCYIVFCKCSSKEPK